MNPRDTDWVNKSHQKKQLIHSEPLTLRILHLGPALYDIYFAFVRMLSVFFFF